MEQDVEIWSGTTTPTRTTTTTAILTEESQTTPTSSSIPPVASSRKGEPEHTPRSHGDCWRAQIKQTRLRDLLPNHYALVQVWPGHMTGATTTTTVTTTMNPPEIPTSTTTASSQPGQWGLKVSTHENPFFAPPPCVIDQVSIGHTTTVTTTMNPLETPTSTTTASFEPKQ